MTVRKKRQQKSKTAPARQVRWAKCVALLLEGHTQTAVAERLRINHTTISNWMAEPEFVAMLTAATDQVQDDARRRLDALTGNAVETIEALLGSEDERVALQAAKEILDRTSRFAQRVHAKHSGEVGLRHSLGDVPNDKLVDMLDQAREVLGARGDGEGEAA